MNHKIMKVKEHKDESHEFFYLFYLWGGAKHQN
jgi:hypothetical protein